MCRRKPKRRRNPLPIKVIRYQSNFYHADGVTTTSYKTMTDTKTRGNFNVSVNAYHKMTLKQFLERIDWENRVKGTGYRIVNIEDVEKWRDECEDN